jgi:hypothetical protein
MRLPTGLGWICSLLLVSVVGSASPLPQPPAAPIVLKLNGIITGADHQKFRAVEFAVPDDIERVDIDFAHDGQGVRTVVDLALYDPKEFRGASGSNKTSLTIGSVDATPSYRPGSIPSGTWKLILGFPNVRASVGLPGKGSPVTRYDIVVRMHRAGGSLPDSAFTKAPIRVGQDWYRGDFHSHTAHSDGSCASRRGQRVPCPSFKTIEAAEHEQLDFIAVTDHNTNAHYNGLRELQPYFDNLLIIPGMELTTFGGHANVLGIDSWPNFLKPESQDSDIAAVFLETHRRAGLVVINHPGLPSNEDCMGCGWSSQSGWEHVDAIEVVNGGSLLRFGSAEGPFSALEYWQRLLNRGHRLTALGSSDSHDPTAVPEKQVPIGRPRSVVYASELSQRALFEGVRRGRVFVDVDGTSTRKIDLALKMGAEEFFMGSSVALLPKVPWTLQVKTSGVSDETLVITVGGEGGHQVSHQQIVDRPVTELTPRLTGCERWIRADVRDQKGNLLLISNPIYFEHDIKTQRSCKRFAGKR